MDGSHAAEWLALAKRRAAGDAAAGGVRVAHLHTRKSGGSSFGAHLLSVSDAAKSGNTARLRELVPAGFSWNTSVREYYSFDFGKFSPAARNGTLLVTTLREPIARWNSSFFYEIKWPLLNNGHRKPHKSYASARTSWNRWLYEVLTQHQNLISAEGAEQIATQQKLDAAFIQAAGAACNKSLEIEISKYSKYRNRRVTMRLLDAWEKSICPEAADEPAGAAHTRCCERLKSEALLPAQQALALGQRDDRSNLFGVGARTRMAHDSPEEWYTRLLSGRMRVADLVRCPLQDDDELLAKCTLAAHDLVVVTEWLSPGSDMQTFVKRVVGFCDECDVPHVVWCDGYKSTLSSDSRCLSPPARPVDKMPADVLWALEKLSGRDFRLYEFAQHLMRARVARLLYSGDESSLRGMPLTENVPKAFRAALMREQRESYALRADDS